MSEIRGWWPSRAWVWLALASALVGVACNPDGACVHRDMDYCSGSTEHSCASTMFGQTPGEFHAGKSCEEVGYTTRRDIGWTKPPIR